MNVNTQHDERGFRVQIPHSLDVLIFDADGVPTVSIVYLLGRRDYPLRVQINGETIFEHTPQEENHS